MNKKMKLVFWVYLLSLFIVSTTTATNEKNVSSFLFLGDSLTEGYGLQKSDAYPAILEQMSLQYNKTNINRNIKRRFINAGVSGSTTASGLSRFKWFLKSHQVDVLVLSLGANDGLRGLSIEQTKKNLKSIIDFAQSKKIEPVLGGMVLPPNYGKAYTQKFKQIYSDLAKDYKLKFIPFMLEGIARDPKYNQKDGIHPNKAGHKKVAELIFPYLKDYLK